MASGRKRPSKGSDPAYPMLRFLGVGRWIALTALTVFLAVWLLATIGMFVLVSGVASGFFKVLVVGFALVGTVVIGGMIVALLFLDPRSAIWRSTESGEPGSTSGGQHTACAHCGFRMDLKRETCPGCGAPNRRS